MSSVVLPKSEDSYFVFFQGDIQLSTFCSKTYADLHVTGVHTFKYNLFKNLLSGNHFEGMVKVKHFSAIVPSKRMHKVNMGPLEYRITKICVPELDP